LLSVSQEDRTVRLWDVHARQETARLSGFAGDYISIALSGDGASFAAAGSEDGQIRLRRVVSSSEQVIKHRNSEACGPLAINSDGTILACGGDQLISLWSICSGEELPPLRGFAGAVTTLSFSPMGGVLAVGGSDATVRLWEVSTRMQFGLLRAQGCSGCIGHIAFSPDGKTLAASLFPELVVKMWDIESQEESLLERRRCFCDISDPTIDYLSFSPDGARVVFGTETTVGVWDRRSGKYLWRLTQRARPRSVFFVPLLESFSLSTPLEYRDYVSDALLTSQGQLLTYGFRGKTILMWKQ
jgi:WD40 repeat protein